VLPETKAGTTRTRKAGEMACYRPHGELCSRSVSGRFGRLRTRKRNGLWGEIAS